MGLFFCPFLSMEEAVITKNEEGINEYTNPRNDEIMKHSK